MTNDPAEVVLVCGNGTVSTCGISCSVTLLVTGEDLSRVEVSRLAKEIRLESGDGSGWEIILPHSSHEAR